MNVKVIIVIIFNNRSTFTCFDWGLYSHNMLNLLRQQFDLLRISMFYCCFISICSEISCFFDRLLLIICMPIISLISNLARRFLWSNPLKRYTESLLYWIIVVFLKHWRLLMLFWKPNGTFQPNLQGKYILKRFLKERHTVVNDNTRDPWATNL